MTGRSSPQQLGNPAPQPRQDRERALLFLVSDNSPSWLDDLSRAVAQAGYRVSAGRVADFHATAQAGALDAIIAHDDNHFHQFDAVLADVPPALRPLRVLVCESGWERQREPVADCVCLPAVSMLLFQLRGSLRLRAQAVASYYRSLELAAEVERQKRIVSEQQHATDEVNLLKNAIVRNVSHELKTPLLQMKSAVALLAEDNENNKLVQYATEATARLEAVVKNITQLASSLEITLSPVLINDLLDQAVRNLRRSWEHKDSAERVLVRVEDHLPPVMGDRLGLGTALQLLIDNGLKFSQKPVEVNAFIKNEYINVAVRDYGIGIAKDQLEKIFETFYQIDNASTRRYGGAGVGLAIVRLILERHGAYIQVESEPGAGSVFTVIIRPARMDEAVRQ